MRVWLQPDYFHPSLIDNYSALHYCAGHYFHVRKIWEIKYTFFIFNGSIIVVNNGNDINVTMRTRSSCQFERWSCQISYNCEYFNAKIFVLFNVKSCNYLIITRGIQSTLGTETYWTDVRVLRTATYVRYKSFYEIWKFCQMRISYWNSRYLCIVRRNMINYTFINSTTLPFVLFWTNIHIYIP